MSKPVGERIEKLTDKEGKTVGDDDTFILAINNYRQSGGGDFPVGDLKEVYNEQVEVRQSLIDWVKDNKVVDPTDFYDENWQVVTTTQDPGDGDEASSDATAEAEADAQAEADGASDGGDADGADGTDSANGDDDTASSDGADSTVDADATADADSGTTSADASDSANGTDNAEGSEASNGSGDANAGGDLPRTGAELATTIGIAAAIIALGAGLVWFARRRRI